MSLTITLELSDEDLQHFVKSMQQAREQTRDMSKAGIIEAASKLLERDQRKDQPQFVLDHLKKLGTMIAMAEDDGFALAGGDRDHVVECLAYFADPHDLIPDEVPVLGYLDDAIMIELCARELEHEIDAYEDFVAYRNAEAAARGVDPATLKTERVEWAEARRVELLDRMRRRRGQSYQAQSGMRLFSVGR